MIVGGRGEKGEVMVGGCAPGCFEVGQPTAKPETPLPASPPLLSGTDCGSRYWPLVTKTCDTLSIYYGFPD